MWFLNSTAAAERTAVRAAFGEDRAARRASPRGDGSRGGDGRLLRARFGEQVGACEVVVLDIPDERQADDPELLAMLDRRVREEINLRGLWPGETP